MPRAARPPRSRPEPVQPPDPPGRTAKGTPTPAAPQRCQALTPLPRRASLPRMFMMRFDMRAPEFGGTTTDLYKAAIEMAEWAETHGGFAAVISEHHTSPDGYIPSPLLLASAMAARTSTLHISIAAALLAFYDPIRLAEDMVVL